SRLWLRKPRAGSRVSPCDARLPGMTGGYWVRNVPEEKKRPPRLPVAAFQHPLRCWLSGFLFARIAQHVAAAPDGFDVVLTGGRLQLLAQLADEDVDDFQFRLVHAAVEMVQEHLLGQRRALAEREQLQHLVFLARQVDAAAVDFDGLGVEIDGELARLNHRLRMALGTAHDRMHAGD